MKKRLAILIAFIMLATATSMAGCSKPDAQALADKINGEYNIALSSIGGDGAYLEFQAETTVEFLADGINAVESYVFKYNEKNGKPNAYVYKNACTSLGVYTLAQSEHFFFDERMQASIFENGVATGKTDAAYPTDLIEGDRRIDDFKAMYMRVAMPAEVFIKEQMVDLKAKRRSNRVIVTASANEDYLSTIRDAYYKQVASASLETAPYMGMQKLYSFDSVEYEYAIRKNRIASKKITINGQAYKLNLETSIQSIVPIKVVQTTVYTYSVNMAATVNA